MKIENTTATINKVEKTGKKITFSFKPYVHKDVTYTINEVIVMYDNDHFMRKYLEISVPEEQRANAVIDYIDLESLVVNDTDAQWTVPTDKGGIVQMSAFKANLGQPIYIQGMFFGSEFPETDNEIVYGVGYMRYYTGKSFTRFGQYNSWFDNMMLIDDDNILESFIEIDRELNKTEVRPLDSYVVDDGWNAYNNGTIGSGYGPQSGSKINETGFWEFNEKFPNALTPSSELVQKFGSNFGVWVGQRGGYNFYGTLANIMTRANTGSKAGGSIDVADRTYVENFKNMAIQWQEDYHVNYWKWDGFADNAYGFSCFDGKEGILSLRNPSATDAKQITFTFDRTMGVAEDAGTLSYYLEHSYLLSDKSAQTGTLEYGKTYTITLQPNEVRILRISQTADTEAPQFERILTDGDKTITVRFNEKVSGSLFSVDGAGIASIEKSADDVTYHITLTDAPADGQTVTVTAKDIKDMSGNALADKTASVVYHEGNVVVEATRTGTIAAADQSLNNNNGFSVSAATSNFTEGVLVAQGEEYKLGINADGKAYFTLNGATAVSDEAVAAKEGETVAVITGVKENNGILKLYVNGTLAGSAYKAENRYYTVNKAAITAGANVSSAAVYDIAYGYDEVAALVSPGEPGVTREPISLTEDMITVSGTSEGDKNTILDKDATTFWTSQMTTEGLASKDTWLQVDLGEVYSIDQVDYTPRYFNGPQNYWACTGNIKKLVVEVSADGTSWQAVTPSGGVDLSGKIVKENEASYFPHPVTFDKANARYIRISALESYHWQDENANKYITVADLAVYGERAVEENLTSDSAVQAVARWTSDNSDAAVLLTNTSIEIVAQPQDQTVPKGGTAVFSVEASGDDLSYQWQYSINGKK